MTRFPDRRATVFVLLALVGWVRTAHADDGAVHDAYLSRLGEYYYDSALYYRAIGTFEELSLFSHDARLRLYARVRIAMSYHRGGELEDAIAAYDRVLASEVL